MDALSKKNFVQKQKRYKPFSQPLESIDNQLLTIVNSWLANKWDLSLENIFESVGSYQMQATKENTHLYWYPPELAEFVQLYSVDSYAGGLYLGRIHNNLFYISLPFLKVLTPYLPNYIIILKEKSVFNFLLGKSIRSSDLVQGANLVTKASFNSNLLVGIDQYEHFLGLCEVIIEPNLDDPLDNRYIQPIVTQWKYLRPGH